MKAASAAAPAGGDIAVWVTGGNGLTGDCSLDLGWADWDEAGWDAVDKGTAQGTGGAGPADSYVSDTRITELEAALGSTLGKRTTSCRILLTSARKAWVSASN